MQGTTLLVTLVAVLAFAGVAVVARARVRTRRRHRLADRRLDAGQRARLNRRVPLFRALPDDLKARLEGDMHVFLDEKVFFGCDGLEVTDEMRLVVAAQACLLQLNLAEKYYPTFTSILLYPDTYVALDEAYDGEVVTTEHYVRAGESWHRGPVVLSWADIEWGLENPDDGFNVVLHEFAHKLDEQDGEVDGAPGLPFDAVERWADVMQLEYERLRGRVAHHRHTVIDEYGATSPPEFFAVAVETFFEKPRQLNRDSPELYAALKDYFRLDPLAWRARV